MIKISADIEELNVKIKKIKRAYEKTIETAGNEICETAKSLVPVKTGKLRGSIRTEKINSGKLSVMSDIPYAFFVEFGTTDTSPQPFLQPAAVLGAKHISETLKQQLKEI